MVDALAGRARFDPDRVGTGLWVLDVDGEAGRNSLNELLAVLGLERIEDLTPCIVQTRSGGLHLYFRLRPGEKPRSRASDIGAGLDTKGEGGSIIAPATACRDGRGTAGLARAAISQTRAQRRPRCCISRRSTPASGKKSRPTAIFAPRSKSQRPLTGPAFWNATERKKPTRSGHAWHPRHPISTVCERKHYPTSAKLPGHTPS